MRGTGGTSRPGKEAFRLHPNQEKIRAQTALDRGAALAVIVFIGLLALFPLRNNDIWWHLAVGKALAGSGHFITTDPFTFTRAGTPWVPHAWLSGLLLYAVHAGSGALGLLVLRAVAVVAVFGVVLGLVRRLGVSWALAAPVVLLAALNAHSRFIVRPHLFEYVMVVLLLGHLLTTRDGRRYFAVPVLLQLAWVNLHASFYLGVGLVALFYGGEWLSHRLAGPLKTEGFLDANAIAWKRVGLLLASMIAVSFVNPSPAGFVLQPLNAEHRELLTAYTLEWRSPFDEAMRGAAFHPYYELLLALSAAAFALSVKRLRLTSLLIVGFFAVLSLKAHRFRVEFALAAVPLVVDQIRISPVTGRARKWLAAGAGRWNRAPHAACIVLAAALMVTARDRVTIGGTVSDRFPHAAFDFVRQNGIARRSFHSVGHGSFLLWDLYPERKAFIDGRNIDAVLHREFLACQTTSAGFNTTINKYRLDGFILPSPEKSDGGMRRTHDFLIQSRGWALVYMDRNAYVYAKRNTVPDAWLGEHAYRLYHPVTFPRLRFTAAQADTLRAELERAVATDPRYTRPLLDSGRFHAVLGDKEKALDLIDRALHVDSKNPEARALKRSLGRR